jgi:hypothetical protein
MQQEGGCPSVTVLQVDCGCHHHYRALGGAASHCAAHNCACLIVTAVDMLALTHGICRLASMHVDMSACTHSQAVLVSSVLAWASAAHYRRYGPGASAGTSNITGAQVLTCSSMLPFIPACKMSQVCSDWHHSIQLRNLNRTLHASCSSLTDTPSSTHADDVHQNQNEASNAFFANILLATSFFTQGSSCSTVWSYFWFATQPLKHLLWKNISWMMNRIRQPSTNRPNQRKHCQGMEHELPSHSSCQFITSVTLPRMALHQPLLL